jgi:hypothetical protein
LWRAPTGSRYVMPVNGLVARYETLTRRAQLFLLVALPIGLRAVLLPFVADFEADAYARMQLTEHLADALRHHGPLLPAMYIPVWPPAWHLTCALFELVWPSAYYVPKVLSAIFGGLTPVLVYALARRISGEVAPALLAWALVALAPLEVLYATSGMSEAFYGFWFVLAALAFVYAERDNAWLLVSAAALIPPSLTRFDGWILLPALVPLAVWQGRARLSIALGAFALVAAAPIAWFALDWQVTGKPLAFLAAHRAYVEHFYATYAFHDLYKDRGPIGFAFHLGCLLATLGVFTTVIGLRAAWRERGRDARGLAAWMAIVFLYLFAMWILRRQMGWRRHYLALGACLAVFAAIGLCRLGRRRALALLAADFLFVLASSAPFLYVPRRFLQASSFLKTHPGRIYVDEPAVRLMLADPGRIVSDAPRGTPAELVGWLAAHDVHWVVFSNVDYSPLGEIFPWMKEGGERSPFSRAFDPPSNRWPLPRLTVYRID